MFNRLLFNKLLVQLLCFALTMAFLAFTAACVILAFVLILGMVFGYCSFLHVLAALGMASGFGMLAAVSAALHGAAGGEFFRVEVFK